MGNRVLWPVEFGGRGGNWCFDAITLPSKCYIMKHYTIVKGQTNYYSKWPQTFTVFLICIVLQFWLKKSHLSGNIWEPRLTSFEIPLFQAFDTLHRPLTWQRNKTNAHRMEHTHTNIWSLKPGLQEDFYLVICVSLDRKIGKNPTTRYYIIQVFFSLL